jgi:DNA-binding GntR family transcriptional regulator
MDHTENLTSIKPIQTNYIPLYNQAIGALLKYFSSGYFKPGDKLPKEETLASQLGISRATLRVAMGYLETRGYIYRHRGSGTFLTRVIENSSDRLLANIDQLEPLEILAERAGLDVSIIEKNVSLGKADKNIASRLGLEEDAEITIYQLTKAINNQPAFFMRLIFKPGMFNIEELQAVDGDVFSLQDTYSYTEIFAETVEEDIQAKLGVNTNQAILKLIETHMDKFGNAISLSIVYILTKYFNFYVIRKIVI